MTPFDPAALLAMLLAFYLPASPANLARAFRERPDYFAGGTLDPKNGADLTLPDGRCFDLIFAAGSADESIMRYQTIECGDGSGEPNPYPLEPGPLSPIDLGRYPPPTPERVFEPLVAGILAETSDVDPALARAHQAILTGATVDDVDRTDGAIADADDARAQQHIALDGVRPTDELAQAGDQRAAVDSESADFYEPAPPYVDDSDLPPPPDEPGPDVPQP